MPKKQKKPRREIPAHYYLGAAKSELASAFMEDESLDQFSVALENGHKLTLRQIHLWIDEAIKHCEEKTPRFAALKELSSALQTQQASGN